MYVFLTRLRRKKIVTLILLYVGLIIFLFTTDPDKLPIAVLILPFIWLFFCLFTTFLFLFGFIEKKIRISAKPKRYELALLCAALPTLLLLLKSIGQLTIRDTIILLCLYALLVFYISKVSFKKHT